MQLAKFVLGLFVLLTATFTFAQDVKTDYDHHADFTRYRTYRWERVQTSNPLWQQRIQDAVDKDLSSKGWQRTESGGDVALVAVGATHDENEYQTFYNGMPGWRWRGFGDTATTTVSTYQVGTLVVDIYDSTSKQLLWRGWASDTLSDKPEKNEAKLNKAIDKMLDHFPPPGKD